MMMPKGELAKRAQGHKIDWFNLVCYGYTEKEPFVDVEMVTLKQHCVDLVIPEAIEYCAEQNIDGDQETLIKVFLLEHNDPIQLTEFVSCYLSGYDNTLYVTVGLNVDVINEEAERYGLELLSQVDRFEPRTYQEFGRGYIFTPLESLQ